MQRRDSLASIAAEAKLLLEESVRTRLMADVPVGVFLSGGVDSTLVAAIAAQESSTRLKTFTVGYDVGGVNETERARIVAERLGSEHHEVTLSEADVAERAPLVLSRMDQPLGDRATLPLHALSEFARPRVTVALGGEGADELFGGYPRYRWIERARRMQAALPGPALGSLGWALRHSAGWGPAARASRRLAPTPVLERNLDWVTNERRHRRTALYGPRLAELDGARVLDDLQLCAGELNGGPAARWLMHLDQRPLPARRRAREDRSREHARVAGDPHGVPARGPGRAGGLAGHLGAPGGRGQGARARDAAAGPAGRAARSAATARRPSGFRRRSGCAARWRR